MFGAMAFNIPDNLCSLIMQTDFQVLGLNPASLNTLNSLTLEGKPPV